MSKFEFCLRPEYFHEIKYDGYRLRVERDRDRVRLITRGGYDRTGQLSLDCRGGAEEPRRLIF
jgi:ATP-dependent DNA ligase